MKTNRAWRWGVVLLGGVLGAGAIAAVAAEAKFGFETVRERARRLAAQPLRPPPDDVPGWLRRLSYDEMRRIEFDGRRSFWLGEKLPFQLQFLHPGFLHTQTVHLEEVRDGRATPIAFRREYFQYRGLEVGELPPTMGFAGFRFMYPLGGPGTDLSEAGAFVGASYFRFLCRDSAYGLSARGLALDTGEPTPEEFPRFTEYWFERPAADARTLTVCALLESESVTGAYRFTVEPGETTTVHVKASVFVRKGVKVFGVAPLTSMFWRGENTPRGPEDFRPEVHDSDGLLLRTGAGEWIWRPLANPRQVRVSSFADENPRGFGLLQRDRDFENYQDLEARYHARPSAWVEPVGDWGRGAVRLLEIPTRSETDDNIAALWVPARAPAAGESVDLEYRLHWSLDRIAPPAGFVRATRHGNSAIYEPGFERFVVDFDGAKLRALEAGARVEHALTVGAGAALKHGGVQRNPINGTWRVAFMLKPDGSGRPVELRCFLKAGNDALTETWSYLWQP